MKLDYIIVGQGLAGSCLAMTLAQRGKSLMVFNEPAKNYASAVAAGLFNPIIGKGLAKTWMAEITFPFAKEFYQRIEKQLNCRFYYPMPMYRPFISVEEQNEWMAQSEGEVKPFVEKIYTTSAFGNYVHDSLGGILVKQSGYVDTVTFINSVTTFLKAAGQYQELYFDFNKLKIDAEHLSYENIEAKKIIFCEGMEVKKNPFFGSVYIHALKGETLTVRLDEPLPLIFNRGVYLVPTATPLVYTVGATYSPNDVVRGTSIEAETELKEKLNALIKIPFTIQSQNWGIRPTVPDRRPVLGQHPVNKNIFLLNGMGTKGVTLAPYHAQVLANWLDDAEEIPNEVHIKRFKSLYSKIGFGFNV